MTNEPKAVVERFLRDALDPETGRWRPDVINECFDVERYFSHTWGAGLVETGRRQGRFFSALGAAGEIISERLVAEGDFVVHQSSRWMTHVGEVLGVDPTGRTIEVNHVEMWRVENGKIVEHWGGIGEAQHIFSQITDGPSEG